jgi:N6-adenosine-specific RNA methylase IME4
MKYRIADIIVKDRKREAGDITSLAESIKEIGLINAITIRPDGTLETGLNRLEACKFLGWEEVEVKISGLEGLDAELAEIDENLIRNELHWIDRDKQLKRRKEIYEEKHPETKQGNTTEKAFLKQISKVNGDNRQLPVSFAQDTANKTNIAERTIREGIQRAKVFTDEQMGVLKQADITPTEATKLAREKETERAAIIQTIATNKAKDVETAKRYLKEEKREQKRDENRQLITEASTIEEALKAAKFPTIMIDPPWDWGDEGDVDQLGRAKPTYGTMTIDDLLKLPVGNYADDNSHLYLWITNRSLPKGFQLLEKWGFRYVTCVTWKKPYFGMGNYFRGQTEHLLFGVKGSQQLKRKDTGTIFDAPRGPGGHSSKPVESYALIESCSPGPYLELFARSNRFDWTSWGAEV